MSSQLPHLFSFVVCLLMARLAVAQADWLEYQSEPTIGWEAIGVVDLSLERETAHVQAGFGEAILLERFEVDVLATGGVRERVVRVRRYLSAEGVRAGGSEVASVRPGLDRIHLHAAFVGRPGENRREVVSPDTLKIVRESTPDIFSDAESVVIPYSGLQPGDSTVLVLDRFINAESWPLPWSRIYWTQRDEPIERFEVVVRWEEGVERPSQAGRIPGGRCEDIGPRAFVCRATGIPALRLDPDVDWADVLPSIAIAEPISWQQLALLERQLVDESAATLSARNPDLSRRLAIPEEATQEGKLQAIYRFVADEIRYVAFEEGEGAVRPRPAQLTLDRGYGDCKDKVALFLAIARDAGLEAYPVLVATERHEPEGLSLPSWRWFDHMMACVDHPISGTQCLELTSADLPTGKLPASLGGAVKLDLRQSPGGPLGPTRLPSDRFAWDVTSRTKSTIHCEGRFSESFEVEISNGLGASMRGALRSISAEERLRALEEIYADATGSDAKPTIEARGLRIPEAPLLLTGTIEYEDIGDPREWADWSDVDPWINYYVRSMRTQNVNHPYRMVGLRVRSEIDFSVCEDLVASEYSTGIAVDLRADIGRFTRRIERDAQVVRVRSELAVPARVAAPNELARLEKFFEGIVASTPVRFGLEVADD